MKTGRSRGPPSAKRLLRVLDALDERGVLRAVLVAHALRRLVERLLVRRYELHARGLELGGGVRDHRVPKRALLELRFARELADQVLVRLRQLVPARLGEDEDLRDDE